MKKSKVVIDTNIFINGWFFSEEHTSCQSIMNLIDNKQILLLFSQDTIGELLYLVKNFARYNIDNIQTRISILQSVSELFYYATSINTMNTKCPFIKDKYDKMFVKCAIKGKADYIISNDYKSGMHNLKNIKTKIVSSEQFVKLFDDREFEQVAVE